MSIRTRHFGREERQNNCIARRVEGHGTSAQDGQDPGHHATDGGSAGKGSCSATGIAASEDHQPTVDHVLSECAAVLLDLRCLRSIYPLALNRALVSPGPPRVAAMVAELCKGPDLLQNLL